MKLQSLALSLLVCAPLLACSEPPSPPTPPTPPSAPAAPGANSTFIGRQVNKALDAARKELRENNLSLGGNNIRINGKQIHDPKSSLPKAEITPQGDLLIEGKQVAIDASQRQLLLAYRNQIIGIAEEGMAIGSQGADLAGKAVGGIMGVIFGGEKAGKEFEERMEAEGKKIELQALQICKRLPALMTSQQALAASLEAFKPYATMTHEDIEDCAKDIQDATTEPGSTPPSSTASSSTASASTTPVAFTAASQNAAAFNTIPAPPFPAFSKRNCAFQRPVDLKLDTSNIKTVQLRIGSDDLHAEALATGASVDGKLCASTQELLDGIQVVQTRQGDKLVVSVENHNKKGNLNINMGPIQYQRYAFAQLHAQVPDNVLVQVIAGSGDVIVNNAQRASVDLGSGDAKVFGTRQDVHAKIGSGDLLVDGAGKMRILAVGSGDVEARNIVASAQVNHVGSGDVKITRSGSVDIGAVGSGDVSLSAIQGNVHVGSIGSGDVSAKNIGGDLTVDAIGSGDVTHRGVSGKISVPKQN